MFGIAPNSNGLFARWKTNTNSSERANALRHKLEVIEETTRALTDIIDTERSARLEVIIACSSWSRY